MRSCWGGREPAGPGPHSLARREAEDTFLATARAAGVGVTAAQLALKFVLDRPEIACAIVGMKTVQQVDETLNAGM